MKKLTMIIVLFFFGVTSILAQERTITGQVTSESSGEPIAGANILVQGTSQGTITDSEGNFELNVSESAEAFKVSFVGFEEKTVALTEEDNYSITLVEEASELDEVVVTALGIEREKKALGYSVEDVSGEDMNKAQSDNLVDQLSGRVAGVNLTQSAGGAGSGTRITIRGNNSLTGNNEPLFVIDGVPVDNSGFGSADGSGTANYNKTDYGTGISDFDANNIKSISILKGPNAAALYGSRASNGVVLITTKSGEGTRGLGVSYNMNYTFKNPLLLPEYQNKYGQGSQGNYPTDLDQLRQTGGSWGPKMNGSERLYWNGENKPYEAQPNNVENFFRTGHQMKNNVSLQYGTEKHSLRFSYTNTDNNSILENSGLTKNNFTLRGKSQLSDKLSVDAKATYFTQEAKHRAIQGTEGIMSDVYTMPRNVPIEDLEDPRKEDLSVRSITESGGNPYWTLYKDKNNDTRRRFTGFAKATYEFTDALSVFARVGTDYITHEIRSVNRVGHWFYPDGRFNYSTRNMNETNADFLFQYQDDFGNFTISGNAGGNMRYETYKDYSISGENFKIPNKPIVSNVKTVDPARTPLREKQVNSLYASATIDYGSMVYLDVSGRNDWSSALPEDNRSYFYPSASLSLLFNEMFNIDNNWLSYSKLSASWAQVGKDTDPYQLTNAYNLNDINSSYLERTMLSKSSTYYTDIKPEKTNSFEIGAELRFFNNRLHADASYYDITSTNLIMQVPVPEATGYAQFNTNVGEISNEGYELTVGGQPIKAGDFLWDVSFNISQNENELIELMEDLDSYTFSTTNSGDVTVKAQVGGGFGEIWGTDYKTTEDGRLIVNADGEPKEQSEKVKLGNYQPDYSGGFNNTFSYKNLTLSALIDFRIGGEVFSGTDAALDGSGVSERSLKYREEGVVVDGVVNEGSEEEPNYVQNEQEISAQDYWGAVSGIASEYIYEQTNFRVRELTLSYNIPQSVIANTFIQRASVSLVGRNLFFIYKDSPNFDPESSYSTSNYAQGMLYYNLPTTRNYGFNLEISF